MIKISKEERKALDKVGLLRYRRLGRYAQDQNFQIVNREHCSRDKTIYVTEEPEIMLFLEKYDGMNLQKITKVQYEKLVEGKMLTDDNTQHYGTYVPQAIAYEDHDGNWRIKKVTKLMLFLGIWKNNKNKNIMSVTNDTNDNSNTNYKATVNTSGSNYSKNYEEVFMSGETANESMAL